MSAKEILEALASFRSTVYTLDEYQLQYGDGRRGNVLKTCDFTPRVPKDAPTEPTCGSDAVVQSSAGKRHRCEKHHEGPGWKPVDHG